MEDDTASNAPAHIPDAQNGDWDSRYGAAWTLLNSAAEMAPLYRLVLGTDPLAVPSAAVVAGRERLNRSRRVGLLPGSFNPLTLAHIALAESARATARLDLVAWGIAARTVDKEDVLRATIPDRLAQLAVYARSSPTDAVLLLNRGLYVEQADALRALTGGTVELVIVVGFDKVVQILDPHYYQDRAAALSELFGRATLLVAPRLDDDQTALARLLDRPENVAYARFIRYLDLARRYRLDSSTEARTALGGALAAPNSARALVPPEASALARLGPYTPAEPAGRDSYTTRARWLTVLRGLDDASLAALPSLADLIARTLAENTPGAELRRLLDAAEQGGEPPAMSLIERYLDGADGHT